MKIFCISFAGEDMIVEMNDLRNTTSRGETYAFNYWAELNLVVFLLLSLTTHWDQP